MVPRMITRRQFLWVSLLLSLGYTVPRSGWSQSRIGFKKHLYSQTLAILQDTYITELKASRHYTAYCKKALDEKFFNIAYLFKAFSISERIHSQNFKQLIRSLNHEVISPEIPLLVHTTQKNLNIASQNELLKIKQYYPEVIRTLSEESHDRALLHCNYSLKSHQQHEVMIKEIKKYSGFWFKMLAKKIESMNPNYFVCDICGSTVDELPDIPCPICNYPVSHYQQVEKP